STRRNLHAVQLALCLTLPSYIECFHSQVENEMVIKNPVRMEGRPGEDPQNGAEPFTAAELSKLRDAADTDMLAFRLLRWPGLQGGDAVKLPWSEVHIDRREIERVTLSSQFRVANY